MADMTFRQEQTRSAVVALATPSNWVEVEKALAEIRNIVRDFGVVVFDDTVRVESDDEEIRFVFSVVSPIDADRTSEVTEALHFFVDAANAVNAQMTANGAGSELDRSVAIKRKVGVLKKALGILETFEVN